MKQGSYHLVLSSDPLNLSKSLKGLPFFVTEVSHHRKSRYLPSRGCQTALEMEGVTHFKECYLYKQPKCVNNISIAAFRQNIAHSANRQVRNSAITFQQELFPSVAPGSLPM